MKINGGFIGVSTDELSIPYKEHGVLSYQIVRFTKDTLLLRRPLQYHDTVTSFYLSCVPYIGKDYLYYKPFRKNGKPLCKLYIIDAYTYKVVLPDQLKTISYPPGAPKMYDNGCIFCAFIPVYNIFYLRQTRKKSVPRTYNLSEWKLVFPS